jgi:hypothetical protein
MAWTKGINFRQTSGYVTDAADDTYLLDDGGDNGEDYPVTRNGVTFGYTSVIGIQERDRNSSNNAKLAGFHFPSAEASEVTVRVDLTAAGTYNVRVAMGDPSYARTGMKAIIRDNGSDKFTVSGNTASANNFLDATSADLTHNDWVSSNTPQSVAFASTVAQIVIGDGATGPSTFAHVSFEQLGDEHGPLPSPPDHGTPGAVPLHGTPGAVPVH